MRDDLGAPVMVLNTECEATSCYGVRQEDTDRFRYWEVAGASHVSLQAIASSAPRQERDFGFSIPSTTPAGRSTRSRSHRWSTPRSVTCRLGCATGRRHRCSRGSSSTVTRPPSSATTTASARGGIRLPSVEVPLAHNSAIQQSPDVFARLMGFHEDFPVDKVRGLYGSRDAYLDRYEEALRAAAAASVVLPRDMDPLVAEAAAAFPF